MSDLTPVDISSPSQLLRRAPVHEADRPEVTNTEPLQLLDVAHAVDTLIDLSWVEISSSDETGLELIHETLTAIRQSLVHQTSATVLVLLPEQCDVEVPSPFTVRSGLNEDAGASVEHFLRTAAESKHDVLLLDGRAIPSLDAVAALRMQLEEHLHFGIALPRIAERVSGNLLPLPTDLVAWNSSAERVNAKPIPRSALPALPSSYLTTEVLGPILLIHRHAAANVIPHWVRGDRPGMMIGSYLVQLRRAGFRTQVVNSTVVLESPLLRRYGSGHRPDIDGETLAVRHPCIRRSTRHFSKHFSHRLEPLLRAAFPERSRGGKTLLIDGRGLGPIYNGTSYALLGLTDGLMRVAPEWDITLHAMPEAAEFHELKRRYPTWTVITEDPDTAYSCVLRANQPWCVSDLRYAHQYGLLNFFTIFDTIAWDIVFAAPDDLTETWQLCANTSDGLLYISSYTGEHFRRRFPLGTGVRELVQHLSLHPADYVDQSLVRSERSDQSDRPGARTEHRPYILVVGNDYDHKCIAPTLELLVDAFPLTDIKVLGGRGSGDHRIVNFSSGNLPERQVEELYADAAVVVFPSLYEGFGFPMLKGLSYGKRVVVRESMLAREILELHRSTGQAVMYEFNDELVDIIGATLHGRPVNAVSLGTGISPEQEPLNWNGVAERVVHFLEECLNEFSINVWMRRDQWFERMRMGG